MTELAEQGTHFWFISIQAETHQGVASLYFQGTRTPHAGVTRQDAFNEILQEIRSTDPRVPPDGQFVVLAFDIQRNELP